MTNPSASADQVGGRRAIVSAARRWCVLLLIITMAVLESVMIIDPVLSAPSGSWFWPIVAAVAGVCWLIGRTRNFSRLLLIVQVVVLWSAVLFPSGPIEEVDGGRRGLDEAILGVGAAGSLRCLAAAVALICCVAAFGPTAAPQQERRRPGIAFLAGLLAAALAVGISIPAGYGLRAFSTARVVASAEESLILDQPDSTGSKVATIGTRRGWSRTNLASAQPVGDQVIGIEAGKVDHGDPTWHSLVGLRSSDGALLWRYRVKGTPDQDSVGAAVIDPTSRMIMIKISGALVGLDFGGRVRYRKPLAETVDPSEQPILIGDVMGDSAGSLQLGAVGVLGGDRAGSPAGFAAGYAVATGERLWQYTAEGRDCIFARATGPGARAYLLAGGRPPCRTQLLAYDGAARTFSVDLHPPAGYGAARSSSAPLTGVAATTPTIAAAGADRIVTAPLWTPSEASGKKTFRQVTQTFDSGGNLLGTVPAALSPGALTYFLPTPLDERPHSRLGAVIERVSPGTSDDPEYRWVVLSSALAPTAESPAVSGSGYERIGSTLVISPWGGVDSKYVVTLARIGPKLGPIERLDPRKLSGCGKSISRITGDDTQLAIRCAQTVFVRPT